MPVLKNGIQFTGSFAGVTAYQLPGSDKIYVRTKGGHSKQRMLTDPAFENPMLNASEFGGCGKAAGMLRFALRSVEHLREPGLNINAQATKLIKKLQKLDEGNKRGTRAIRFSRFRQMLAGFNLHPRMSLDSVIITPIECSIERETGIATIHIPPLRTGVNLRLPWNYPMYRFIIHLSVLQDLVYDTNGYVRPDNPLPDTNQLYTNWQFTRNSYEGQTFTLQLQDMDYLQDDMTLLLSVGIEMGSQVTDTVVEEAKKAGCAKVLKVA